MKKIKIAEIWKNFAVFPCRTNSKRPATKNGFKNAKFDVNAQHLIEQRYNLGLACSTSNIIVIDVDYHNETSKAFEELSDLEVKLGKLPKTLTQSTASGNGRHLIFTSDGITNPIGKLSDNIDIKYNGYIMLAPSKINGNYYQFIDGIDENGVITIADLPQNWINYLNDSKQITKAKVNKITKQATKNQLKNINIDKMFQSCDFLNYCKTHAEDLEEPMWHSMITILAQIENSDEIIHSLSEPYYKYNFEETQKKIDYARDFGFSQSCAYISRNYPNICKNCLVAKLEKGV